MSTRQGFTIVEMLIVAMILIILGSMVISASGRSADDTRETTCRNNVGMLQRQIDLYRSHHNGLPPHVGSGEQAKVLVTRLLGKTNTRGELDPQGRFGPYIPKWPKNPYMPGEADDEVICGADASPPRDDTSGWYYSTTTSRIYPNTSKGALYLDPAETTRGNGDSGGGGAELIGGGPGHLAPVAAPAGPAAPAAPMAPVAPSNR